MRSTWTFVGRTTLGVVALMVFIGVGNAPSCRGAATAVGNVTPAVPAAGGTISNTLEVGDADLGFLTIDSGTGLTVTQNLVLGDLEEGMGVVTVEGYPTELDVRGDLVLGDAGSGDLLLVDAALFAVGDDVLVGNLAGSSGVATVEGLGTKWDVADDMIVGTAGRGAVEVLAGGRLLVDAVTLGSAVTSYGEATIDGRLSLWRQTGLLTAGVAGAARLTVTAGGQLETAGAALATDGTGDVQIVIRDQSSAWTTSGSLLAGGAGHAQVQVLDGAILSSAVVTVGDLAGGEGVVQLLGDGTRWQATGAIVVGDAGQGTVRVFDGARWLASSATRAVLGDATIGRGTVTVAGTDAVWELAADLVVGDAGVGALQAFEGGRIATGDVILANNSTARGELEIDGLDSIVEIDDTLDVALGGPAEARVRGGLLDVGTRLTVGSRGQLLLDDGRVRIGSGGIGLLNQGLVAGSGRIDAEIANSARAEIRVGPAETLLLTGNVTNSGRIDVAGGSLELRKTLVNKGQVVARDATLRLTDFQSTTLKYDNQSGSQLAFVGGDNHVFGNLEVDAGAELIVGNQSSVVFYDDFVINGDFQLVQGSTALFLQDLTFGATAAATVELAPLLDDASVSSLDVSGAATLAGTLAVTFAPDAAPALGDVYALITAEGGLAGSFVIDLPALPGGLAWDVAQSPQALALHVVGLAGGDFNGDGLVDGADFALWEQDYGTTRDGLDLLQWQRDFAPAASAVTAAPVPEAASLLLALVTGAACAVRRPPRAHRSGAHGSLRPLA